MNKTIYLVLVIVLLIAAMVLMILFYNQKIKNVETENATIKNELEVLRKYAYQIETIGQRTDSLKKSVIENDIEINTIQRKINELKNYKYQPKPIDIDLIQAKKTLGIL